MCSDDGSLELLSPLSLPQVGQGHGDTLQLLEKLHQGSKTILVSEVLSLPALSVTQQSFTRTTLVCACAQPCRGFQYWLSPLLFKQVKTLLQNFWESSIVNHHPASLGSHRRRSNITPTDQSRGGLRAQIMGSLWDSGQPTALRRSPSRHT